MPPSGPARTACVLLAALLLGGAPLAAAHAIVTKASLEDRPIRADVATPVILHFNTGIEVPLTKVVLLDGTGHERALAVAAGDEPGTVVVELPALAVGSYALRYRVLAADGHVTEDTLRFDVTPSE